MNKSIKLSKLGLIIILKIEKDFMDITFRKNKLKIRVYNKFFYGDIQSLMYCNTYVLKKNKDNSFIEVDNNIESNIVFCDMQDYYFN